MFRFIDIQNQGWFDKNDLFVFINQAITDEGHEIYPLSERVFIVADSQKRGRVSYWELYLM